MRFALVFLPLTAGVAVAVAEPDGEYHLPGAGPVNPIDYYHLPSSRPVQPTLDMPVKERVFPPYTPLLPDGAKRYAGTKWTQEIFQYTGGARIIRPFPIANMDDKRWQQPGGMLGVTGWKVEKFKSIPGGDVKHYTEGLTVKNSIGTTQVETAIKRTYPIGTRFDEVLLNADSGKVFEHRVREKAADGWKSHVEFADEGQRPTGYTGLTVSCSSCHSQTGSGKYAEGLVPGGDGVFSDELDLSFANEAYNPRLIRR